MNAPSEAEKNQDQVALESQDKESLPAMLLPHAPLPGL